MSSNEALIAQVRIDGEFLAQLPKKLLSKKKEKPLRLEELLKGNKQNWRVARSQSNLVSSSPKSPNLPFKLNDDQERISYFLQGAYQVSDLKHYLLIEKIREEGRKGYYLTEIIRGTPGECQKLDLKRNGKFFEDVKFRINKDNTLSSFTLKFLICKSEISIHLDDVKLTKLKVPDYFRFRNLIKSLKR